MITIKDRYHNFLERRGERMMAKVDRYLAQFNRNSNAQPGIDPFSDILAIERVRRDTDTRIEGQVAMRFMQRAEGMAQEGRLINYLGSLGLAFEAALEHGYVKSATSLATVAAHLMPMVIHPDTRSRYKTDFCEHYFNGTSYMYGRLHENGSPDAARNYAKACRDVASNPAVVSLLSVTEQNTVDLVKKFAQMGPA